MKKITMFVTLAVLTVLGVAACSSKQGSTSSGKTIKAVPINNLTATASSASGQLKKGDQEIMIAFTDSSNKPVDVGAVSLNFHMPKMGAMTEMNDGVTFTTTDTPGIYRGKVNVEVGGEWQGQLAYEGPAGKGKTTFPVTAQ